MKNNIFCYKMSENTCNNAVIQIYYQVVGMGY